ncbi:MAG TPA: DUF1646 family protein [Pseudogracilibacillus sp.]|nr:DUF1646 family protein [Pseudogracilibacillus sp.]
MIIGLIIILLLVLFLPFTNFVGRHLEAFLFIMGIISVFVSQVWSMDLITEALTSPIYITLAVLGAGLLFRWFQKQFEASILKISNIIPYRLFIALFVIILGLISSLITAIIAAIILVSVITVLRMDRQSEIRLVILACYAIGLGAVLTPLGEPLSTIVTARLDEEFFYLLKLVGVYIFPGVIAFGILSAIMVKPRENDNVGSEKREVETYGQIVLRSLNIYIFVMALTFLGAGFQPFIERFLLHLDPLILYWINIVSAILDNATLAAAEISPQMTQSTIKAILLGLTVSGGMLIPGNIPNIIAAANLRITSLQYARFAVPVGFIAMIVYFIVIILTV